MCLNARDDSQSVNDSRPRCLGMAKKTGEEELKKGRLVAPLSVFAVYFRHRLQLRALP
jgi:hypothetical protein